MDSTLIGEAPSRSDVTVYAVPATQMASDAGLTSLSNMILVGKLLRECLPALDTVRDDALWKVVPPKKAHLIEANQRAIALGSAFEG